MSRINIVCSHCGSDDVRRDAFAAWSVEKQEWELAEVYDQGHCVKCEGDASLEEIELEPGETGEIDVIDLQEGGDGKVFG
jgi:hypothetical protein